MQAAAAVGHASAAVGLHLAAHAVEELILGAEDKSEKAMHGVESIQAHDLGVQQAAVERTAEQGGGLVAGIDVTCSERALGRVIGEGEVVVIDEEHAWFELKYGVEDVFEGALAVGREPGAVWPII